MLIYVLRAAAPKYFVLIACFSRDDASCLSVSHKSSCPATKSEEARVVRRCRNCTVRVCKTRRKFVILRGRLRVYFYKVGLPPSLSETLFPRHGAAPDKLIVASKSSRCSANARVELDANASKLISPLYRFVIITYVCNYRSIISARFLFCSRDTILLGIS